jgi:hypothetical protein
VPLVEDCKVRGRWVDIETEISERGTYDIGTSHTLLGQSMMPTSIDCIGNSTRVCEISYT